MNWITSFFCEWLCCSETCFEFYSSYEVIYILFSGLDKGLSLYLVVWIHYIWMSIWWVNNVVYWVILVSLFAANYFLNVVNAYMLFCISCVTSFKSWFIVQLFCIEAFNLILGVSEDVFSFLWSIRNLRGHSILGNKGFVWLFSFEWF